MEFDKTLIEKGRAPTVEEMQDYFKKNDYTAAPLPFDPETGKQKDVNMYMKAREFFKKSWLKNQKDFGGKGSFVNFSNNYPVAVLENADEQLIAGAVTNIFADEELYNQIIDSFFDTMQPKIELAFNSYANEHNKNVDDLTEDEMKYVIDSFVDLFLNQMINLLMQSQSVPELINSTNTIGTHEDFNDFISENRSREDFYRKWDHTRTKIGKIFSFSELSEGEDATVDLEEQIIAKHSLGYSDDEIAESETLFMKIQSIYCSMLDEVEKEIYKKRMQGLTVESIAIDLGYKSHSTIVKKLKKMRVKFDEMCKKLNQ